MIIFSILAGVLVLCVLALLFFSEGALSKRMLISLSILIPSIAFVFYQLTGTPRAIETQKNASPEQLRPGHNLTELEHLVEKLAKRLEKEPEDIEGWLLLARSYAAFGYTDKATAAFSKATQLQSKIQTPEKVSAKKVSGVISVDPRLKNEISPSDTVFIFAKALDDPKPPVAAMRLLAKELPFQFVLDDTLAMVPDRKLSNFSEVMVEARITKSGNPIPQPGDLEGSVLRVRIGSENVQVVVAHKR